MMNVLSFDWKYSDKLIITSFYCMFKKMYSHYNDSDSKLLFVEC